MNAQLQMVEGHGLECISILNNGPDIVSTNYFDDDLAQRGMLYASMNAGAVRLLIPESQLQVVPDMLTGHMAVVTRGVLWGREALEFLFDDNTDTPFALHLLVEMMDRRFSKQDIGRTFPLTAWDRSGKVGQWHCGFRVQKTMPCLKPWRGK